MAEEVKPIYKRFTDRCIKYYVFKQYTLIAILCISAGFYDEEDDIVDFRIINYILKIKIINKEVYIY